MSQKYAENTSVPVEQSKAEIERCCVQHRCTEFATFQDPERQMVAFRIKNLRVRFEVKAPAVIDFKKSDAGRRRTEKAAWDARNLELRRRWRALLLCIKAKFEVVDTGISTFEQEFLAHILLPGGETFGERMVPRLAEITSTGKMPPLLPAPKESEATA